MGPTPTHHPAHCPADLGGGATDLGGGDMGGMGDMGDMGGGF